MKPPPIITKYEQIRDLKRTLEKTRGQLEAALNEIVRFTLEANKPN